MSTNSSPVVYSNVTPRAPRRLNSEFTENSPLNLSLNNENVVNGDVNIVSNDYEKQIETLKNELAQKDAILKSINNKRKSLLNNIRKSMSSGRKPLVPYHHVIDDNGRTTNKMNRGRSLGTSNILEAMGEEIKTSEKKIAENFLLVFKDPLNHLSYLQSKKFAEDIIKICDAVEAIFEEEAKCLSIQVRFILFSKFINIILKIY